MDPGQKVRARMVKDLLKKLAGAKNDLDRIDRLLGDAKSLEKDSLKLGQEAKSLKKELSLEPD